MHEPNGNTIELIEKHNLKRELVFRFKMTVLILQRYFRNGVERLRKFSKSNRLKSSQVIAASESDLWNKDDNNQNRILTACKVQNLRIAGKKINGVEVAANETFSFWKHIGNPNFGKGFVVGREIREGCIVPTIAGGLCQLSNALYDAALKANFEIVERHKHSKVIKGSLAEKDRDATVKWNYIDLRFRSKNTFRIEVDLTADKLIVCFKAVDRINEKDSASITGTTQHASKLNDCYSCGNIGCFKHPEVKPLVISESKTTFILDEKWKELDDYVQTIATENDTFIVPFTKSKLLKTARYSWNIKQKSEVIELKTQTIYRALMQRLHLKLKRNPFETSILLDRKIAIAAAKRIPIECTHVVVSQNLLPHLWETGALGGRTFEVLMTRLPIEKLQEQLNFAHTKHPQSKTLNDFRAPAELMELESVALTKAQSIVTPHTYIAELFKHKTKQLHWYYPLVEKTNGRNAKHILFPASGLARKGAYEVRQLAKDLNLSVIYTGKSTESEGFWNGVDAHYTNHVDYANVALVVYPAFVEHQPKQLLKALSAGKRVVTTQACGIAPQENLILIDAGDYDSLLRTVEELLQDIMMLDAV